MREDVRYNCELRDEPAGQGLGLILDDPADVLAYRRALSNPYAAKASTGDTGYHDLTDWSMAVFADWTAGRGYEEEGVAGGYFDAQGVEARVAGQLTLGPLPQVALASVSPEHVPGNVTEYLLGYPGHIGAYQAQWTLGLFNASDKNGQRFALPGAGDCWVWSIKVRMRKYGSGHTGSVKGAIYSDVDGLPDTELVSVTKAHGDIGATYAEEVFTFSTPYGLTGGAYYWLVIDQNGSGTYDYSTGPRSYADGYYAEDRGSGWSSQTGRNLWFEVHWAQVALEQSFTTPAAGMSCDEVQLYLRKLGAPDSLTVGIYADTDGSPSGAALKSDIITEAEVDTVATWVSATWTAEALDGSTVYHMVLTSPAADEGAYYLWGGDADAGYEAGAAQRKLNVGSWAAASTDLYFRAFDSSGRTKVELDGTPVAFARFNDGWYCAAGDTVYKWNTSNHNWDTSEASAGNDITGLAVWAGYLWVARGTATNVRKLNTSAEWGDAGFEGGILYAGGHVAGGWLHIQDADSPHQFRYTSDGTTLSDPFEVGSSDYSITGFAWMRDMLIIATTVGLYGFAAQYVVWLFDWRSMEHKDNGKAMFAWGRDGALYIPLMYGLYRWNGDTFRAVGPEQGAPGELEWQAVARPVGSRRPGPRGWVPVPPRDIGGGGGGPRGLPAQRAGAVLGLWGTNNWLYALIEGGQGHTSSVMATDGMHGWHEVARAEMTAQVLGGLGYESLSSPARLWYGLALETRFLEMPDFSDNPYLWTGLKFQPTGELVTPWVGTDLVEVVKDWHQVIVRGESFTSGQRVEVWYEVDRSGQWRLLGEVQSGPRKVLPFTASVFASKIVGSGSTTTTIELGTGTTGDLAAGKWVRINSEVAQVASVTDADTFVLATALSEVPRPGDYVYSSRPAGRELRLKLILKTDNAVLTPKVEAVLIEFQPNVMDRWTWALGIKCANDLEDLRGAAVAKTGAQLRLELAAWARRLTPCTFVDIDGETWTVKVSAASERAVQAKRVGEAGCVYRSVWDVVLLQVA